jgi:hypothetical protein
MAKLHLHSLTRLHGVVLNELSTETTLPLQGNSCATEFHIVVTPYCKEMERTLHSCYAVLLDTASI